MATIEPGDYDQWRERLQTRAVDLGWSIPAKLRGLVIKRITAELENPETDFKTFLKAVEILAKLDRAEQTAVANAVNVTRWASGETNLDENNDSSVLIRVPKPMRGAGVYYEQLFRLAGEMESFGLPAEIVDSVRNFNLNDLPESDTPPRPALMDHRPDKPAPDDAT